MLGKAVVTALLSRQGELRAFVTDADVGARFKQRGVKVAVGDVSDASHIGGAALNAFSAVLIGEAAVDGRERAFAATPEEVVAAWAEGIGDAGVHRAIWIGHEQVGSVETGIRSAVSEMAVIETSGREAADIAEEAARLDEAASL